MVKAMTIGSKLLPKWVQVINALRKGATLKLESMTLMLIETEDGQTMLVHPAHSTEQGEVYLSAQIMFNDFIQFCEALDEGNIPIAVPHVRGDRG